MNGNQTLLCEIIAPDRQAMSRSVDMVVVPGKEGDLGVMKGHMPLIAALRAGTVHIFRNGRLDERYFVSGGIARINGGTCTILAEDVVSVDHIDRSEVDRQYSEAEETAKTSQSKTALTIARRKTRILKEKKLATETRLYQ